MNHGLSFSPFYPLFLQLNQPLLKDHGLVAKGVGSIFVKSLRPGEEAPPSPEEGNRRKRSALSGVVVDTLIAVRTNINGTDIDDAFANFNDSSSQENSTYTSTEALRK